MLQVIPAIDLKDGKCVRLEQGRMDSATVFGENPAAMAAHWASLGAERIHIVDLDGAVAGKSRHKSVIKEIIAAVAQSGTQIQVGGGIRDESVVNEYLELGVTAVILGTVAVTQPDFAAGLCRGYPGQVIIGLDVRDGKPATAGWTDTAAIDVIALAKRFDDSGSAGIIYTDIARDGMLSGINIEATVMLANSVSIPVIASGGLHSLEDIVALKQAGNGIIAGVIAGRSLYQGTIDYREALELAAGR